MTVKLTDLMLDIPLIFKDRNGHQFELEFEGYVIDGMTDWPCAAILKKGARHKREDL